MNLIWWVCLHVARVATKAFYKINLVNELQSLWGGGKHRKIPLPLSASLSLVGTLAIEVNNPQCSNYLLNQSLKIIVPLIDCSVPAQEV